MAEQIERLELREESRNSALAEIEVHLLLEAVQRATGYDFREYAPRVLRRRIADRLRAEGVATISALQDRVLHDAHAMAQFVRAMSGAGNRLFADAPFFASFRRHVVPLLRTYSFTRIWNPNCVRAEDAFSLAVVLEEEGLLDRCMIYATDASELAIGEAKSGEFHVSSVRDVEEAYAATGASLPLAAFAQFDSHTVAFRETLRRNMVFARHTLGADSSLNEFHVIVLRGVLAQYTKALQYRVYSLLVGSLSRLGFLCLGPDETMHGTPYEGIFNPLSGSESIYRRMR